MTLTEKNGGAVYNAGAAHSVNESPAEHIKGSVQLSSPSLLHRTIRDTPHNEARIRGCPNGR